MSRMRYFLALNERDWLVVRTAGTEVTTREVIIREDTSENPALVEVATVMKELGYRGEDICLGLPSGMIFAGLVDCQGLPRNQKRTAMLFRLEEQLPMDAEALTVDFLPPVVGKSLGVAVETQRVRDLIDALASAGIQVAAVCATSLLALWQLLQGNPSPPEYVVIASDDIFDVFRLSGAQPVAWYSIAGGMEKLVHCIEIDFLQNPSEGTAVSARLIGTFEPALLDSLTRNLPVSISAPEESAPAELATVAAEKLLAGKPAGYVNFRQGELALSAPWRRVSGLARTVSVLTLVLLAVLAGIFYLRGRIYAKAVGICQEKKETVFRHLHPGQGTPADVRENLEEELKRLSAVTGSNAALPKRISALETLRGVLTGLPQAVRLRIVQIQVAPGGVVIEGQGRTHADAELIGQALKKAGFAMEPPRTEALSTGGVSFNLAGKIEVPAKPLAVGTGDIP